MAALRLSVPSHLSIFITDPDTGRPTARLPLYVEVAVPRIVPVPPSNERFREPIRAALLEIDPGADPVSARVEAAAQEALGRAVDDASRDQLVTQPDRVRDLFHQAFGDALNAAQRERIGDIPEADLVQLLEAAIRRAAPALGIGLLPETGNTGSVWAHPLGVLTTDHVGYASFDLTRLGPDVQALLADAIEARRTDPLAVPKLAIWVYPYGRTERFEALSQARFTLDAVVARLSISWNTLTPALINMGPRALQNPSLTDWQLSPASFAASPKTLVGADGCEELVPANLALQQFVLRHVVRLADPLAPVVRPRAAYIDEYKVSWYSLGHSLGEILYSLPLAPGETVKLAVVDWSWDSLTKRDETTRLTEDVLHQTHRDRTVTETVKAGIRELQHGSSFMGGTAGAAGATGTGKIDSFNVAGAVGQTWSLGGSTATSDGSRDVAAEMVQRVGDSFSQASSVQRELNSTVVIQARQEQKESIQTRTFSNYNHSHTLTILYYEVLRHYRVTVEWVRRRHAALVAVPKRVEKFDEDTILKYRHVLESALLDPSLKPGFDALAKLVTIREDRDLHGLPKDGDFHHLFDGDLEFSFFEFGTKTSTLEDDDMTNESENSLRIWAIKADGALLPLGRWGDFDPEFNSGGRFRNRGEMTWFLAYLTPPGTRIRWHDLAGFMIDTRTDTWRVEKLAINGFAPPLPAPAEGEPAPAKPGGPRKVVLRELKDYNLLFGKYRTEDDDDLGDNTFTEINPPPPPPAPILSPKKSLTPEERHQLKKLVDHCALYKDYYASLIVLNTDPASIAIQFENEPWGTGVLGGTKLADHLEPTPLEVFGSSIAYPLIRQPAGIDDTAIVDLAAALNGDDPARRQRALTQIADMNDADRQTVLERLALASAKSERLITLPTRGVFAEGKLGHCNISEVIDNTRFWKWDEHPIPINAPDIAAAQPIQPKPEQVTSTPTAFPQAVVSISNPGQLPDPTGLVDALKLLGTPNIFRDMSGRAEVADLLKKLSDNSISISEAANKARDIQAKYGAELDKQQKAYDLDLYKAANEATAKDSEVRRAAQAQASKAQAEAAKANADAGNALAAAAKNLPQGLQAGAYQEAARVIQGNPVTNKAVVFQARGYDDQTLEGKFELTVRDIQGQKEIIAQEVGPSFDRAFSFSTPEPVIGAVAKRVGVSTIKILDEVVSLPAAANVVSPKEPYVAGKSHQVISVTLAQTSRTVSFKAASTNAAVTELMNKWGTEFGAANALATKMVADYEKKHQITHPAQVEPSYSIRVPTHTYELTVSSR